MSTSRTSPASFIKHATDVSLFYGFRPAREIERAAANRLQKRVGAYSFDTVALLSATYAALRASEPTLAFYASPAPQYLPVGLSARDVGEFGLMVVGAEESVGEIVMLKTVHAIFAEWGTPVSRVRLNMLGDRESQQRFMRELALFVRKQAANFDEACRAHVIENPTALYQCSHESCRAILENGPHPTSFLSEKSRAHFRLMLEQLENLGLPYEIDNLLVGDERDPHVIFAFELAQSDATILLASGGRYDDYVRKHTGRKESAGVAANIYFRKSGASRSTFAAASAPPGKQYAPKIYFVQLGPRAKLQGLSVLDLLRRARIPVSQSFDSSHLSPQLATAQKLGVSHMLIMGQREALDGTVIVRSTANSSQTVVEVHELPRFLKNIK